MMPNSTQCVIVLLLTLISAVLIFLAFLQWDGKNQQHEVVKAAVSEALEEHEIYVNP